MSFLESPNVIVPDNACRRPGRITLVGAGPGAADLLTLRAMRCLGQADVIFYDRLVDKEVLEFASPCAEKVFVGKEVGSHAWPQDRIDAAIVAAALAGRQVVRLKSGDPSIFGRAAEEIAAALAHGIAIEVVAGVTAASAAAASLCQPLTERGVTDRVVLATATCRPGEEMSQLCAVAQPGTTLVFYMAMHRLADLAGKLVQSGVHPDQPVIVACDVTRARARSLSTRVQAMAADCAAAGIRNPAVIMIRLPKAPADTSPQTVGPIAAVQPRV